MPYLPLKKTSAFVSTKINWSKYNWSIRSGKRKIITEKVFRRYFSCQEIGCNVILFEDFPYEETENQIKVGKIKIKIKGIHNHPPPIDVRPRPSLLKRAKILLKTMEVSECHDFLEKESKNKIGIPSKNILNFLKSSSKPN